MLYYRAKQSDIIIHNRPWVQTIKNELFTPAEYKKYSKPDIYGACLKPQHVECVEISRKKTYWFFGARFEIGNGYQPDKPY